MKKTLPSLLVALFPVPLLAQATVDLVAAPGAVQVAPGVTVPAWLFNGTLPGPTLRVLQGQTLRVRFHNDLPEASAVHWHGQPVPLGMDGVPGISRPAVAPGQEFLYELNNLVPGTYWFHPHGHETQLDVGLAGVLIVDPANPLADPAFDVEQIVVLDEWTSPFGGTFSGHLLNGRSSAGQAPMAVQPGQRLRLRIVNASAVSNYVIALDAHSMTVTHADGNRVQPVVVQAIPIGIGERYDVIVDCNNPGVWSLAAASITNRNTTLVRAVLHYAGQTQPAPTASYVPANLSGGSLLSYAQLAAYFPVRPIAAVPDRVYTASLGMSMGPGGMQHTINGQAWPNVTPFLVASDDDVQMTFVNTGMMMSDFHPMHVHGHFFRLMGTAGGTAAPPLKDTVLIRPSAQPGSSVQVQVAMDNPGRWLLHCHNMNHMAGGMMTTVEYVGDADADGIPDRSDYDPLAALPVVTIPEQAAMFAPGASGQIELQWTPGQVVGLFGGPELPSPVAAPPYGMLWLDPQTAFGLGVAVAPTSAFAPVGYVLPANPALSGVRLGLQGVGTLPAPPGFALSTFQAFTVR